MRAGVGTAMPTGDALPRRAPVVAHQQVQRNKGHMADDRSPRRSPGEQQVNAARTRSAQSSPAAHPSEGDQCDQGHEQQHGGAGCRLRQDDDPPRPSQQRRPATIVTRTGVVPPGQVNSWKRRFAALETSRKRLALNRSRYTDRMAGGHSISVDEVVEIAARVLRRQVG